MGSIEILIIWVALCLIPAYIAGQKGRSAFGFFLLSILLSPIIGLIVVVLVSDETKKVTPAAITPQSAVGVADELAKLTTLRDQGHITLEEFDRQRAILLPPVPPPAEWGPNSYPGVGKRCGKCGKPLSPSWRGKCSHCGASYAEFNPTAS